MISKTYQILTNLTCNLRCEYCYENMNGRVQSKENVDNFLTACFERDKDIETDVFVELIGGESLIEMDIVDNVCLRAIELSKAYNKRLAAIGLTTNGTTLGDKDVRDVLLKYKNLLGIGISIDGTKENHDKYRIDQYGNGTYDRIVENLPWLFSNFSNVGVKATYTNETFNTYSDGVKNLVSLGFKRIAANLIYEDTSDGAACLKELLKVADYFIELNDDSIDFFQLKIENMDTYDPFRKLEEERNYCGSCVHMTCLGFDDNIYGCNRFCTMNKPNMEIGTVDNNKIKIVNNKLIDDIKNQYTLWDGDCETCKLKPICPSCVAAPYETDSIQGYIREKRMCGWTHAQALARHYYSMALKNRS